MTTTPSLPTTTDYRGFKRGLAHVKTGDYKACVSDLYGALGINNRTSFYFYLNGKSELKATQAAAVIQVFAKYGVSERNIFGV